MNSSLMLGIGLCIFGFIIMVWFAKNAGLPLWQRAPVFRRTLPFLIILSAWVGLLASGFYFIWQAYPLAAIVGIVFILLLYVRGFFMARDKTRAKKLFEIYDKFKSYPNLSQKEIYIKTARFYYRQVGLDHEDINFKIEMLFKDDFSDIQNVKQLAYYILSLENPTSEYASGMNIFKKMEKRDKAINKAYDSFFGKENNAAENQLLSENKRGKRWKFILLIIFGLLIAQAALHLYFNQYDSSYLVGDVVAKSLGAVLSLIMVPFLISIVAKLFKRSFTRVFLATLSFITIPLFLISSYGHYHEFMDEKEQAKKLISGLESHLTELTDSTEGNIQFSKRPERKADSKSDSDRDFIESFEGFMRQYTARIMAIRNNYNLELEKIGINDILDQSRMSQDPTFTEAKLMIKQAKETAKKHRDLTVSFMTKGAKNQIAQLDIRPSLKERMISGYQNGLPQALRAIDRQWDLEERSISEVAKIVNLLCRTKGSWEMRNNIVYFSSDNDMDEFNSCLKTIQACTEKQQEIQSQAMARAKNKLKRIKEKLE